MDPAGEEYLPRNELIKILNERRLNIPNIELLTYAELLRIYNTFAVPLEKRQPKRFVPEYLPDESPFDSPPNKPRPYTQDVIARTTVFNEHFQIQHEPHILQQAKLLKLSYNPAARMERKRKRFSDMNLNGEGEGSPLKKFPLLLEEHRGRCFC